MSWLQDKYNQGCACYAGGDYAGAEGLFRECLTILPGNPDLLNALGSALEVLGKLDEAAGLLEKACRLRPENAVFHYNLGNLLRRKGKRDQAENEYLEAIRCDGEVAEFLHGLGSLYLEGGRLEQAESCLRKAVELAPGFVLALHDLGLLRQSQGKLDQAEELFLLCLDKDGSFVPALNSLGMLFLKGNEVEQARKCFMSAIRQNPDYLQARGNLAVLSTWCGELEYAVRELTLLAELAPNDGDMHFNLSLALLASGRMAEGWQEHEWRFSKASPVENRHALIPRWQGESLTGKRLLIHAEQGYGDSLQFIRFAGMLAEHGAIVLVEAQDRIIAPLLVCVTGVSAVYARGETAPPVDYQIPMMSLPLPLGKNGWPPPAPPYLSAQPDKVAAWQERLRELKGLKVGLAWAGRPEHANDANRSIPEGLLAPFGELAGVSFVSLQVGSGKPDALPFIHYDPSGRLHDFSDSAALVSALDLVITVDSAVAHLAGGLGAPVWVLLPWNPDWRWQYGRSDSDWYPSARLFRQNLPGHWEPVIGKVVEELALHRTVPLQGSAGQGGGISCSGTRWSIAGKGPVMGEVWQVARQDVIAAPHDITAWRRLVAAAGQDGAGNGAIPEEAFLSAFQSNSSCLNELVVIWLYLAGRDPYFVRVFDAAADNAAIGEMLLHGELDQLFENKGLRRICQLSIICSPDMESLLTAVRRAFCHAVHSSAVVRRRLGGRYLPFICSLALLCYNNEYVFNVTEEELKLVDELAVQLGNNTNNMPEYDGLVMLLGCYRPLYRLPFAGRLTRNGNRLVEQVLTVQLNEPLQELELAENIPVFGVIDDEVSGRVRSQYEENPYPRWISLRLPVSADMDEVLRGIIPGLVLGPGLDLKAPHILVAGCGTGQHPIYTRCRFRGARVLAIDLSAASLAYALRKCNEMGIDGIDFMQADILALESMQQCFDMVECGGVLHHMADPVKGWEALLGLLKPHGIMGIGLYSSQGRKSINEARKHIKDMGYKTDAESIRSLRQEILSASGSVPAAIRGFSDFYTISGCRDMLFNVQEHQFDLMEIAVVLERLKLEFLGFQLPSGTLDRFRRFSPQSSPLDLLAWQRFEEQNPDLFSNMYQFFVRKAL